MASHHNTATLRNNSNKKVIMNENELEKLTIFEDEEAQTPASAVTTEQQVVVAKSRPNLTWQMSTPVSLSRHSALKFRGKKCTFGKSQLFLKCSKVPILA